MSAMYRNLLPNPKGPRQEHYVVPVTINTVVSVRVSVPEGTSRRELKEIAEDVASDRLFDAIQKGRSGLVGGSGMRATAGRAKPVRR